MNALTAGRQAAVLPSWRYWATAFAVYPLVLAAPGGYALYGSGGWWPWLLVGALVGACAAGILRERHVRSMPAGWRAVWLVIGLGFGTAAAYLLFVLAFFGFLIFGCWGQEQCLG